MLTQPVPLATSAEKPVLAEIALHLSRRVKGTVSFGNLDKEPLNCIAPVRLTQRFGHDIELDVTNSLGAGIREAGEEAVDQRVRVLEECKRGLVRDHMEEGFIAVAF